MRGPKNRVDVNEPYAWLIEPERAASGRVEDVATIFLTNRECPFSCVYCDLWKNTTDQTVPVGAIPRQIDFALAHLPPARHIKLYNSGNFFDRLAIPPADYHDIARRVCGFETVIVENHPRLCDSECRRFHDLLAAAAAERDGSQTGSTQGPELEIALGLETVHPAVLPRLNKQMTTDDFQRACEFLQGQGIALRAFILLKPPYLGDDDCVEWALKSVEFAYACGVRVCAVIPTRAGNELLLAQQARGEFSIPRLSALEAVAEQGIRLARGRLFVDVWDVERLFECPLCGPARAERLRQMNLSQQILPAISCSCA
ncbi:MAG: radical SAM protein [Planctomycetes bacterium]|nr:radical SAM protein [Planctomycetota bacterium]